jgi:hypothetical protein
MPLPKPEHASPPGALTHLTGDGAEKLAEKLGKMGWQSHWPHFGPKAEQRDFFEYSLPARLELSAANPALVLDLPPAADAAAVQAAAAQFGEVRPPASPPLQRRAAPPERRLRVARARETAAKRHGAARYAGGGRLRAAAAAAPARVPRSAEVPPARRGRR